MSEDTSAQSTSDESAAEEEAQPMNRAERRAKGKKTSRGGEVFSKGQQPVGRGTVQSPRQYGTRRSG